MIGNSINGSDDANKTIFQFLGNFVGIVLITIGALVAIYAIIYIVRKAQNIATSIVQIIVAAMFITLGILSIIFLRDNAMSSGLVLLCKTVTLQSFLVSRRAIGLPTMLLRPIMPRICGMLTCDSSMSSKKSLGK